MWRLPCGERWLGQTSALCLSPEHAPTHEDICFSEGNVGAVGPHFGQDLMHRINSQTEYLRQSAYGIHMLAQQTRPLLVYLADLPFEELQLLQRHL